MGVTLGQGEGENQRLFSCGHHFWSRSAGPHSQSSELHVLWVFHETSVALKHNYQSFRILKFEIHEMVGGLCCCPHECCCSHSIASGLSHGIMGNESSQGSLWIILEDEEWLSSSTFLYLHHAQSVVPEAYCATGCIWVCQRKLNYTWICRMDFQGPVRIWEQNNGLNYLSKCTIIWSSFKNAVINFWKV